MTCLLGCTETVDRVSHNFEEENDKSGLLPR
jgi:hypothetical protein